jgi:hypothetical protein
MLLADSQMLLRAQCRLLQVQAESGCPIDPETWDHLFRLAEQTLREAAVSKLLAEVLIAD